jgi:environmental stress-induced protein Ves
MQIIRANTCRVLPWKNGGGSTTEVAVSPPGASTDDFDWRISMARVASDGPFSHFAGIDRTLAVIKGRGLVLTVADRAPVELATGSDSLSFPGDTPTSARLTDGEIIDLNVMTRRGRFTHDVLRVTQARSFEVADGDIAIALSLDGHTLIVTNQHNERLDHGDAIMIPPGETAGIQINPAAAAQCYLVRLRAQKP